MPPPLTRYRASGPTRSVNGIPKPQKQNVACIECRVRKEKCDSGRPCTRCKMRSVSCVSESISDLRRKGAVERKLANMERSRDLLFQLVVALQNPDEMHTTNLFNVIRDSNSLDDIQTYFTDHLKMGKVMSTPELDLARQELKLLLGPLNDPAERKQRDSGDSRNNGPLRFLRN